MLYSIEQQQRMRKIELERRAKGLPPASSTSSTSSTSSSTSDDYGLVVALTTLRQAAFAVPDAPAPEAYSSGSGGDFGGGGASGSFGD